MVTDISVPVACGSWCNLKFGRGARKSLGQVIVAMVLRFSFVCSVLNPHAVSFQSIGCSRETWNTEAKLSSSSLCCFSLFTQSYQTWAGVIEQGIYFACSRPAFDPWHSTWFLEPARGYFLSTEPRLTPESCLCDPKTKTNKWKNQIKVIGLEI